MTLQGLALRTPAHRVSIVRFTALDGVEKVDGNWLVGWIREFAYLAEHHREVFVESPEAA
jgi:hypothetical protein